MTMPTIGPKGSSQPTGPEPVTNSQVLRIVAFIIVVLPTAIAVNVVLWHFAAWIGRQS